jgi:hypothetical protein
MCNLEWAVLRRCFRVETNPCNIKCNSLAIRNLG